MSIKDIIFGLCMTLVVCMVVIVTAILVFDFTAYVIDIVLAVLMLPLILELH